MIKNLLFDLGGVIMDIRRESCVEAFEALGMSDISSFLGDYGQKGPFAELEEGKISDAEFRDSIRAHIPGGASDEAIDRAFNAFLLGIPLHRLHSLEQLRPRFGLYLLSNTNHIMWAQDIARYFNADGKHAGDYFDGMVTSFEAHSYKPDEEIFRHAARTLGIKPEETLFLDDSQANLDAAARLGFHTALVAPGTEFTDITDRL